MRKFCSPSCMKVFFFIREHPFNLKIIVFVEKNNVETISREQKFPPFKLNGCSLSIENTSF